MIAYYLSLVLAAVVVIGGRRWYQSALAKQAARDEAALRGPHPAMETAKFGAKYSSPAMAAKHDQTKTEVTQKRESAAAARRRAKAAKVVSEVQARPSKVTPMRKVAK